MLTQLKIYYVFNLYFRILVYDQDAERFISTLIPNSISSSVKQLGPIVERVQVT